MADPAHVCWDPEARFEALDTVGALSDDVAGDQQAPLCASNDFTLFPLGVTSNNRKMTDWIIVDDIAGSRHRSPVWVLSSAPLTNDDMVWIEEMHCVQRGAIFASAGANDSASLTEHSWDPERRWGAMAPKLRLPRGHKDIAHLEVLRLSDPTPGTLQPRKVRPAEHEHSYDPMDRWAAVAPTLRVPRGHKDIVHLEVLRLSDPTPGTLQPRKVRPAEHEHSYDPMDRWAAVAPALRVPRGLKDIAHLDNLRHSKPAVGVGGVRAWTSRGPAAGWLRAELDDAAPAHSDVNATAEPGTGEEERVRPDRMHSEGERSDGEEEEEETSTSTSHSWQSLSLRPFGSGRLPRIVSNQLLDTMLAEAEAEASKDGSHAPAVRHPFGSGRLSIGSMDSDSELEEESIRSAALTAERRSRQSSERFSNDTIVSFLEEASDGSASVDYNFHHAPPSPVRSPARRPEPARWAPPRGVLKDPEMIAREAARKELLRLRRLGA